MKRITMTEFRKEPGETIRAVQRHGQSFEVTKAGKVAALLVPADDSIVIEKDGTVRGEILPGLQALRKASENL